MMPTRLSFTGATATMHVNQGIECWLSRQMPAYQVVD